MFGIGALSFAAPWVLSALLGLPILWWLLRVTPPTPRNEIFPSLAFLLNLRSKEESAQHTPLWLLIFRLLICLLLILGLAGPIWNAQHRLTLDGPLVLFVDNGWASADDWQKRQRLLDTIIDEAAQSDRPIVLIPTAPDPSRETAPSLMTPAQAANAIGDLKPHPWAPDRLVAAERLGAFLSSTPTTDIELFWLGDNLDHGAAHDTAERLLVLGQVTYLSPRSLSDPLALSPPEMKADRFVTHIRRGASDLPEMGKVSAIGERGQTLASVPFQFAPGETQTQVDIQLPLELRNETQWLKVDGRKSASTVFMLDDRWRRRAVGIVSQKSDIEKPLLSDVFYPERAIRPFAEVKMDSLTALLGGQQSVLILGDIGQIPDDDFANLDDWISAGGTLVRFAGPHLAASDDPLVPVPLRQGGRALGGALSWAEPQALADFDEDSPFFGLRVPEDVTVSRQVLAEPSIELSTSTWARLHDGTPLVTAAPKGDGWIVLFHVTSNADWSTLPLSGLFVEMLQRIVDFSHVDMSAQNTNESYDTAKPLKPIKVLDAYGRLGDPQFAITPIASDERSNWTPTAQQPPGLYGTPNQAIAFNLASKGLTIDPLKNLPAAILLIDQNEKGTVTLGPWMIALGFLMALIDSLIILYLSGKVAFLNNRSWNFAGRTAAIMIIATASVIALLPFAASAQDTANARALEATLETRLAFVIANDSDVNQRSKAGLKGLTQALRLRTAAEPGDPIGVNLENDELAFFPMIYWPILAGQPDLSSQAIEKLNRYMKTGGTIVIDTADQHLRIPTYGGQDANTPPNSKRLREILSQLDVPPLTPVPEDHVLTKSFYLLQDFPGRWVGGQVWVEAGSTDNSDPSQSTRLVNDGVSSIIIGSNDWAAAWALDERGRPMVPLVPGGDRQRELALRFGVNLVMYSLTGNYKADQVHVPALLERLGQ